MNVLRLTAVLTLLATSAAGAQPACSNLTVSVRGTPLTVGFCLSGAATNAANGVTTVSLEATYATKGHSMVQRSSVRFITGVGPARALDSVNLAPVGIDGTLHMTLLYSGNQVSMEHALLTPGAVTVK
jgi:hypothetical protein